MSVRAILFFLVWCFLLFKAFQKDPFYGVLAYFFEYYNHPPLQYWGDDLPDLRWSFLTAIIVLIAIFVRLDRFEKEKFFSSPQTLILLAFVVNAYIVLLFAYEPEISLKKTETFLKIFILYFLMFKGIKEEKHLRYIFYMIVIGTFLFGFRGWDNPHFEGGRLVGIGGPDSANDNSTAAHSLMALPFVGYFLYKENKIGKAIAIISAPFIINLLVLCSSRGSFVGALGMGVYAIFFSRKRMFWYTITIGIIAILLLSYLAHDKFWDRQKTTIEHQEDHSASTRLVAWAAGLEMLKDNPFGIGATGNSLVSAQYIPLEYLAGTGTRALHNTYLEVAVDYGIQGFFLYMSLYIISFIYLYRIRKKYPLNSFPYIYTFCLELALIGTLIPSIFLNRALHEGPIWLIALSVIMYKIYLRKESSEDYTDSEIVT